MPWDSSLNGIHNDDITVVGRALNAVKFISVNWEKVEARATMYIRENIAMTNRKPKCTCISRPIYGDCGCDKADVS